MKCSLCIEDKVALKESREGDVISPVLAMSGIASAASYERGYIKIYMVIRKDTRFDVAELPRHVKAADKHGIRRGESRIPMTSARFLYYRVREKMLKMRSMCRFANIYRDFQKRSLTS